MNLSRGTMMRLPRVMVGNPCGGPPRRRGPDRCPAHGTHPPRSASAGVRQKNCIWIFSFSSFLPSGRKGFSSLFCGPVFAPLTWSCRATAPHGHPACGPGPCASPAAFSAAWVDLITAGAGLGDGVVPEHPAHVMEQPGHRQHRRGRTVFLQMVQKVLCILVALLGGLGQPMVAFSSS